MTCHGLSPFDRLVLALGLAFLYLPMLILVLYSFNASRLVTVWGGFSLTWYKALAADRQLIEAAVLSLEVAAASATLATLVATLSAIVLTRHRRNAAHYLLELTSSAPLVLPEIILGLAFLLLFVALDIPRGFVTVTIAHASIGAAFAGIVIRSRLARFDQRLEEAASDLGCPPWKVFVVITLPLNLPAIIAAWLLAFTLSLDDLVVASFTTGPGATTLPMRIYSSVRLGVSPEINAVSTIMIAAVALVLLFSWRLAASARPDGNDKP